MKKLREPDFSPRVPGIDSRPLESVPEPMAKPKRRILVVDDDPNNSHLIKILLERSGPYLVLEENHDTDAHQTARSFKPDLILLDIAMQGLDGGEVAEQIQADEELHNTPIIFLTGLVTKGEAKSGLQIDGHPVLAKPISIPELIETIETHLHA
ncbi:MAG TPA: response regulator [Candidatus Udaeobacter sp.]|jgi:CheY-like chemotaxis protein